LNDVTGDARYQVKKLRSQSRHRDYNHLSAVLQRFADQFDGMGILSVKPICLALIFSPTQPSSPRILPSSVEHSPLKPSAMTSKFSAANRDTWQN
jgi:hypothetical protein